MQSLIDHIRAGMKADAGAEVLDVNRQIEQKKRVRAWLFQMLTANKAKIEELIKRRDEIILHVEAKNAVDAIEPPAAVFPSGFTFLDGRWQRVGVIAAIPTKPCLICGVPKPVNEFCDACNQAPDPSRDWDRQDDPEQRESCS